MYVYSAMCIAYNVCTVHTYRYLCVYMEHGDGGGGNDSVRIRIPPEFLDTLGATKAIPVGFPSVVRKSTGFELWSAVAAAAAPTLAVLLRLLARYQWYGGSHITHCCLVVVWCALLPEPYTQSSRTRPRVVCSLIHNASLVFDTCASRTHHHHLAVPKYLSHPSSTIIVRSYTPPYHNVLSRQTVSSAVAVITYITSSSYVPTTVYYFRISYYNYRHGFIFYLYEIFR